MKKHMFWRLTILFLIIFWGGFIYLLTSCCKASELKYEKPDSTELIDTMAYLQDKVIRDTLQGYDTFKEYGTTSDLEWLGDTLIVNAKAFKVIIIKGE